MHRVVSVVTHHVSPTVHPVIPVQAIVELRKRDPLRDGFEQLKMAGGFITKPSLLRDCAGYG
jgi:hypothetical protein